MTDEQKAAYVNSQVACAQVELEAMRSTNRSREAEGLPAYYTEMDFRSIIDRFVIGHNDVIGIFHT